MLSLEFSSKSENIFTKLFSTFYAKTYALIIISIQSWNIFLMKCRRDHKLINKIKELS